MRIRSWRSLLVSVFLVFAVLLASRQDAEANPVFNGVFNYTDNRGPGGPGISPGWKFLIGAYVSSPEGNEITSVTAAGTPSYELSPYFAGPLLPNLWMFVDSVGAQSGSWSFTATDNADLSSTVMSYPLSTLRQIPLATNLSINNSTPTPTISWDPVFMPFTPPAPEVGGYQVRLMTSTGSQFYRSPQFGAGDNSYINHSFTIPAGVLAPGENVTVRLIAIDNSPTPGAWQNTSSTFATIPSYAFYDDFNSDAQGYSPNPSPVGFPNADFITSTCAPSGDPTEIPCSINELWVNMVTPFATPNLVVQNINVNNPPRILFHPDPAEATGSLFTISWRSASMQASNSIMFDLYASSGGGPAARIAYSTDGNIVSTESPSPLSPLATYGPYIPQRFSMVVDFEGATYDLWIDGAKVLTAAPLNAANNTGSFSNGYLVLWENTEYNSVLIDDIRMSRGADTDGDGLPDAFADADEDSISDDIDNCPTDFNPGQADGDADGVGDLCDNCPVNPNPLQNFDACSANASGVNDQLSPVLVQACFRFTDADKEYVFRPTCANTVWELTGGQGSLESTGCVNGPAAGIPDDLVPVRDGIGNPITYCTEPCNLLDRFLPEVLTPSPGVPANYQATATFTTLIQCPPGESIPGPGSDDVCPEILMVSVKSEPIEVEIPPEMNRRIDVYPGTYPNLINLGSTGNTPVAILGSPSFDVTTVSLASVKLAGASVAMYTDKKTKQKQYMASTKDFNGDGHLDLMVHFVTSALGTQYGDTTIVLTIDDVSFGEDSIQVVRGKK